ncbi:hypothetical protein [Lachnobacterium bovis]|uniref:Uncharacterized protein n=1 Tax=Lachnobacterium bovis DSM 14045 TaxID=1122142 RepID=A0A1H3JES9_9FIRM|nr:hypothetical protein [Lachnobacterium bovis]SDY38483.1 hypothetical protein SAMN02910414_01430 [Lachnobacterium bovis DSM 14045]
MEASKYDKDFLKKEERRKKEDRLVSELRKNQRMREDLEKNLYEIEKENERYSEEYFEGLREINKIAEETCNLKEPKISQCVENIRNNILNMQKQRDEYLSNYKRLIYSDREKLEEEEKDIRTRLSAI